MLISHPMTDTLGSHPRHSPDYITWPALPQPVVREIRSQLGSRCERRPWLLAPRHVSGFLLMWPPHLNHFLFLRHFLLQPGSLSSRRRGKGRGGRVGGGRSGVGVRGRGGGVLALLFPSTHPQAPYSTPNLQLIKNVLGHVKGKSERVLSI